MQYKILVPSNIFGDGNLLIEKRNIIHIFAFFQSISRYSLDLGSENEGRA